MGILECISGAVRELFGATDEITKGFFCPAGWTDSPLRTLTRAGIGLPAAENSPNLAARFGGCGEMGVLALYEQTPSRLPVVQDCNYRAEGAGPVVNRQRHGGPSGAILHCRHGRRGRGSESCRFWMERRAKEGRRCSMQAVVRELSEFRHLLGENPSLQLHPSMDDGVRTRTGGHGRRHSWSPPTNPNQCSLTGEKESRRRKGTSAPEAFSKS